MAAPEPVVPAGMGAAQIWRAVAVSMAPVSESR